MVGFFFLVVGVFVSGVTGAADTAEDRFLGKWLGTVEANTERVTAGLEIRRADDGALAVFLTLPIINRFEVTGGGGATVEGEKLIYAPFRMELTLVGDTLTGAIPRIGPMELHRVEAFPEDEMPGDFPTLEADWQVRTSGRIYASPVVADDTVYVGATSGVFLALDATTGRERWRAGIGYPILGAAVVYGDAVYFVSDGGLLHKLDRADGTEVWRYSLGAPAPRVMPHLSLPDWDWHSPAPVIADGVVFVGGADGSVHAIDSSSGEAEWSADIGTKVRASAAIAGDLVVFGNDEGHLRAFARADGAPAWTFETGGKIETALLAHDGRIIVGNRGFGVFSIDAATGEEAWRVGFWGSWVESAATAAGDTIYIGSSDLRRVTAIDADTGQIEWRSDVFGWAWGTPLVVDDRLYIGTAGGEPYSVRHLAAMTALDRADGRIVARTPLPASSGWMWGVAGSPVRAGDRIIVATIEGGMLAFVP